MLALVVVAERLHPARALEHLERSAVGVSVIVVSAGSSPTVERACHDVTTIIRSCPALAAAPVLPVLTVSVPASGPSR